VLSIDGADLTGQTKDGQRSSRDLTEKREAIVRAARHVLSRVGYFGASIDVIAADAEVSTRTIYNKFESKEQLFSAVLTETFDQVAAAREALIGRYLGEVTDLEGDLIELAKEWVRPPPELQDHFAITWSGQECRAAPRSAGDGRITGGWNAWTGSGSSS
jgi:AcrR family transcriptional regulator